MSGIKFYSIKERVPRHGEKIFCFTPWGGLNEPVNFEGCSFNGRECRVSYPFIDDPLRYRDDYCEIRACGAGSRGDIVADLIMYCLIDDIKKLFEDNFS